MMTNKMFEDTTKDSSKQNPLAKYDKDFADIVTNYIKNNFNPKEANERLKKVLDFINFINPIGALADHYCDIVKKTGAVKELTDPKVLDFAKHMKNSPSNYLDAMQTVESVKILTSKEFMDAMDGKTLKSIADFGTYMSHSFFGAIGRTGAFKELTDPKVMGFIKSLGVYEPEYLNAMKTIEAVKNLTSKEFMDVIDEKNPESIINFLDHDVKYDIFYAIGKTGAFKELTDPKVMSFAKDLGNLRKKYFMTMETVDWVKELTDPNVMSFIKILGNDAFDYLEAMKTIEAVKNLTSKDFINAVNQKTLKSISNLLDPDVRYDIFYAIGKTGAFKELTDPKVLDFIKPLGYNAPEYFKAMKTIEAVKILTSKEFIESTNNAMNNALNKKTLKLIKSFDYDTYNNFFDAMIKITFYSKTHKLSENLTFLEDPIIKSIKPENANKDPNKFKIEVKGWSNVIKNFEMAEEKGFGSTDKTKFDRLLKLYSRTGGSIEYISFASNFIKSKEDFETLLSGEKGKVDKMIVDGVNSYFVNYRGLPKSIEGWGGIKILRLVWDNKEVLAPEFLLKVSNNDKKGLLDEETFNKINKILPKFNSPYIKTYELHSKTEINGTNNITDETNEIISDTLNIIKEVFPNKNIDEQQASNQIKEEFESFKKDIGGNLNNKVNNILNKSGINENLENLDLQKVISIAKNLKEIKKEINNRTQSDALNSYEKIIDSIEGIIASKYYNENIVNSEKNLNNFEKFFKDNKEIPKDEMESYIKLAGKTLNYIYYYIADPDNMFIVNSSARDNLFNASKNRISEDLQKIEKHIHTEGVLTVKSWDRSLNDLFGGRFSGDCTAPPTIASDYFGVYFEANIRWLKDPGTLILNVYWKDKIDTKQEPIGRIYCFAAEMDGKPAIFIDSLEFIASFNAGEEVQKVLPKVIKDLSKNFEAPVALDIYRISNRTWVNDVIHNARFDQGEVSIKKVGNGNLNDKIFMEHLSLIENRRKLNIYDYNLDEDKKKDSFKQFLKT